ncbi:tryptophan synthase subunit alpha [bacterium]|nr:tryptophan synthase subunit alpha [bacterium]
MAVDRINAVFDAARRDDRAAFVGYLMAGDPSFDASLAAIRALADAGADVIEIGAPFTDPMADGPSIQQAALRSLKARTTLSATLELARRFRESHPTTPVVLMGYANPVHSMGWATFAERASAAGVDGVIMVDLPPEEDAPLREALAPYGLAVIRLATPTTDAERMAVIADGASGFIYYVSVAGVTGAGIGADTDIASGVNLARRASGLPVVVGFGVRTPDQAERFARIADGVVVGSALVELAGKIRPEIEVSTEVKPMSVLAKTLSIAISQARN